MKNTCQKSHTYIEGDNNVLADSIPSCRRLVTEQKLVNAPHLIPPSDGDSIDEIEGYLNVNSEEFGHVL